MIETHTKTNDLAAQLHDARDRVEAWFATQWEQTKPPIYSSIDMRNAGFKIAPVDTNLFPAGFNNLSADQHEGYAEAMHQTLARVCPGSKNFLLIPESHSRNIHYFESVTMLQSIIEAAGFQARLGSLDPNLTEPMKQTLPSGRELHVEPLKRQGNRVALDDYSPCCIVLNNDLSDGIPELLQDIEQNVMPSLQFGWYSRLKSDYFRYYAQVADEFASEFKIDAWLLSPLFDQCPEVDFMKREGRDCLVMRAQGLIKGVTKKYDEYNVKDAPFLVVKADQGTYGMAVMMLSDPNELHELNRKQRTRMSVMKGGKAVTKAIIQEGVPTIERVGGGVSESVMYAIGERVVGGFHRVHADRGGNENLNTPGMEFKPLAINLESPEYYLYTVIARLAVVAAGRELARLK